MPRAAISRVPDDESPTLSRTFLEPSLAPSLVRWHARKPRKMGTSRIAFRQHGLVAISNRSVALSNTLFANEGHCIDLGPGIVVCPKEPDVLHSGRHWSPGGGMFLTGHFTLPVVSGGAFVVSGVVNIGVAATDLTIPQDKYTAHIIGRTIAGVALSA